MMDHRAVGQVQVSWSNPVGAPKKKNMHEYHLPEDKPLALYHLIWEKLTISFFVPLVMFVRDKLWAEEMVKTLALG